MPQAIQTFFATPTPTAISSAVGSVTAETAARSGQAPHADRLCKGCWDKNTIDGMANHLKEGASESDVGEFAALLIESAPLDDDTKLAAHVAESPILSEDKVEDEQPELLGGGTAGIFLHSIQSSNKVLPNAYVAPSTPAEKLETEPATTASTTAVESTIPMPRKDLLNQQFQFLSGQALTAEEPIIDTENPLSLKTIDTNASSSPAVTTKGQSAIPEAQPPVDFALAATTSNLPNDTQRPNNNRRSIERGGQVVTPNQAQWNATSSPLLDSRQETQNSKINELEAAPTIRASADQHQSVLAKPSHSFEQGISSPTVTGDHFASSQTDSNQAASSQTDSNQVASNRTANTVAGLNHSNFEPNGTAGSFGSSQDNASSRNSIARTGSNHTARVATKNTSSTNTADGTQSTPAVDQPLTSDAPTTEVIDQTITDSSEPETTAAAASNNLPATQNKGRQRNEFKESPQLKREPQAVEGSSELQLETADSQSQSDSEAIPELEFPQVEPSAANLSSPTNHSSTADHSAAAEHSSPAEPLAQLSEAILGDNGASLSVDGQAQIENSVVASLSLEPLQNISSTNEATPAKAVDSLSAAVTESVVDQVVETITNDSIDSLRDSRKLTLQIHPAELGRLEIQIGSESDILNAQIVASEHVTSELLNREKIHLINALQEMGVDLPEVEISHRNDKQENPFESQNNREQTKQHRSANSSQDRSKNQASGAQSTNESNSLASEARPTTINMVA